MQYFVDIWNEMLVDTLFFEAIFSPMSWGHQLGGDTGKQSAKWSRAVAQNFIDTVQGMGLLALKMGSWWLTLVKSRMRGLWKWLLTSFGKSWLSSRLQIVIRRDNRWMDENATPIVKRFIAPLFWRNPTTQLKLARSSGFRRGISQKWVQKWFKRLVGLDESL